MNLCIRSVGEFQSWFRTCRTPDADKKCSLPPLLLYSSKKFLSSTHVSVCRYTYVHANDLLPPTTYSPTLLYDVAKKGGERKRSGPLFLLNPRRAEEEEIEKREERKGKGLFTQSLIWFSLPSRGGPKGKLASFSSSFSSLRPFLSHFTSVGVSVYECLSIIAFF